MIEEFKKYDQICALAINWLVWNIRQSGLNRFCFTNIDYSDENDLWLLSIMKSINGLLRGNIYIQIKFWDYLRLKYIYGFKFLRYNFYKKNIFSFDAKIFETEVLNVFNETSEILGKIYCEYYKRR